MGKKAIAGVVVLVSLIVLGIIFWPQIRDVINRVAGTGSTARPEVKFTDYSFSSGFNWGTWMVVNANLTVTNQGNANATGVQIIAKLYGASGVRDSKTSYVGTLSPGSYYTASLTLDGDLFQNYYLWFEVSGNEGTFHRVQSGQFNLSPDISWLKVIATIVTLFG